MRRDGSVVIRGTYVESDRGGSIASRVGPSDQTEPAMSQPDQGGLPEDRVLWDVVEEHLAEAEFLVEQLERAFDSPTLTLKTLEKGVEARLLAHVDGLVVGGRPVYERLLKPVLDEPDRDQATLVIAAGLVAVESGRLDNLRPALGHAAVEVRVAMVNACSLAADARLDAWVLDACPVSWRP